MRFTSVVHESSSISLDMANIGFASIPARGRTPRAVAVDPRFQFAPVSWEEEADKDEDEEDDELDFLDDDDDEEFDDEDDEELLDDDDFAEDEEDDELDDDDEEEEGVDEVVDSTTLH